MKTANKTIQTKADAEAIRLTCGYAVEDIIDYFIGHDKNLFDFFKGDVRFVDLTSNTDTVCSKEEITNVFINLKEELSKEGYGFKSGPFIDGDTLEPKCYKGVSVKLVKDGKESYITFGVESSESHFINKVIRYK